MSATYHAYGLALVSSFELPGMLPCEAPELPAVTLRLVTKERLRSAWGGSDGSPSWRGRLGDGEQLTIQRGAKRDLLFSYGERARFLLDSRKQLLSCAPSGESLDWQRTLLTKVLPIVSVVHGREALHASAVDSPDGVIAILAPSGTGKTTLALELMERGRALVCDDILTLGATPDGVLAFPATPHLNIAYGHRENGAEQLGVTLGVLAGERWMTAKRSCSSPRPVRLLCLLQRGASLPLDVRPLAGGPLPFAPYMLGLPDDQARQRRRFALYADLASSTTILRITCGTTESPADIAELIERELGAPSHRLPVGVVA